MYPNNGSQAEGASQINKTSIMTLPNLISPPVEPTAVCKSSLDDPESTLTTTKSARLANHLNDALNLKNGDGSREIFTRTTTDGLTGRHEQVLYAALPEY